MNAAFQRRARRDKKAFLSNQCKEIEENNRMGKTKISSRKLEIPREHFMLRWAQKRTEMIWTLQKQKILRRCGNNKQKNYTKNIFMTQIITMV